MIGISQKIEPCVKGSCGELQYSLLCIIVFKVENYRIQYIAEKSANLMQKKPKEKQKKKERK